MKETQCSVTTIIEQILHSKFEEFSKKLTDIEKMKTEFNLNELKQKLNSLEADNDEIKL